MHVKFTRRAFGSSSEGLLHRIPSCGRKGLKAESDQRFFAILGVHVAMLSAILSLGVGDAAASLIGSRFGVHHWPRSQKTLEGTCACVVMQLVALLLLTSLTSVHFTSWIGIVASIVLTSLFEAFTTQIDNLVLPVFMHTLLLSLQ